MKAFIVVAYNYIANKDLIMKVFDNENAAKQYLDFINNTNAKEYEWGLAKIIKKEIFSEF